MNYPIIAISLIIRISALFTELKCFVFQNNPMKFVDVLLVVFKKVIKEVILFPLTDEGICLEIIIIHIIKTCVFF